MILYTIMPVDDIYPLDEADYLGQKQITYQGIDMIVRKEKSGEHIVVRILSSNPQHYLTFMPGQTISVQ